MKVFSDREIRFVLKENGYYPLRQRGDHVIYKHETSGDKITIKANKMNRMVGQRLIKEHNLKCKFYL